MKVWIVFSRECGAYTPEHLVARKVFSSEKAAYEYAQSRSWPWDMEEFEVEGES